jgi:hypothetical protein
MQVGYAAAAAAAAQVFAQLDCGTVRAEAVNEIGRVENPLVFAPAAGLRRAPSSTRRVGQASGRSLAHARSDCRGA